MLTKLYTDESAVRLSLHRVLESKAKNKTQFANWLRKFVWKLESKIYDPIAHQVYDPILDNILNTIRSTK